MAKKPTAPVEKESKIEGKGKTEAAPKEKKEKVSRSKFPADHIITLHVDYNPKRPKSASFIRFENYEDEMTVEEALKAGVSTGDLNWDTEHDFIGIDAKYDDDYEKRSKPEPKAKPEKPAKEEKPAAKGKGKKKAIEEDDEDC